MQIGTVQIESTAALAPMAGICDLAFRAVCKRFEAAYVVGEMVSAKGITYNGVKSLELLRVDEAERPVGMQLFGSEPEAVAQAAKTAMQYAPDVLDLNMGCPTPKITGNGCGSALLKDPKRCGELVRAVVKVSNVPVTAKIRIGWDADSINCVEVAKILEDAGAAAITVHGRTRAQMYAPSADWTQIAAVKAAVSVPVIGNGDIFTHEDALRMYEETGCDLVMVGRGAMGNPWLFQRIAAARRGLPVPSEPTPIERMQVMREHITMLCQNKGEYIGMREARNHISHYLKGLRGAAALRAAACKLSVLSELDPLIEQVLEQNKGDLV